jgi:histidine ammonia-lyase
MTSLGSISEQRISKMVNPAMSGLPAFLAPDGGLNSGFMIVHVAAASLVSENKVLAHPASVDSIPTSADKEDHVSMGTIAARKFKAIVKNTERVIAMEILTACQALDLLRPLKTSTALEKVHALVRQTVPFAKTDRNFGEDIEAVTALVVSGQILD